MAVVSLDQLSRDMQRFAAPLVNEVGIIPQAGDRPLDADDLLFYLTQTSIPMADFMNGHGLFADDQGLHFDVAQFGAIRDLAQKVIAEHLVGNTGKIWTRLDLSTDEDADNDGGYILTAIAALELMYGGKS
jgi:hypothetical protein